MHKSRRFEDEPEGGMKDQISDLIHRRETLKAESLKLKLAEFIVIIGGGVVGCELLGEILSKYPKKKYVLLSLLRFPFLIFLTFS